MQLRDDGSSARGLKVGQLAFSTAESRLLTQWLLLHHQEDSVNELNVFGQVIELKQSVLNK